MSALRTTFFTVSIYEKLKTLWPLFMDGVQGDRASARRETVYFSLLSPQEFLVLIQSISANERLK